MAYTNQISLGTGLIGSGDISTILEKIIAPRIEDQLPDDVVWYKILEKNMYPMQNNSFYITLRSGRHTGVSMIAEGDKLKTGKPGFIQALIQAKYAYGTFDISDQAIESAKGSPGALANILTINADYLRKDFARQLNRVFWKANDGVLAIITASAATGTSTLTVSNYQDVTTSDTTKMAIKPTKYIIDGGSYAIATISSSAFTNIRTLTVTSHTDTTITGSIGTGSPASVAANDVIIEVNGDNTAATEAMGVQGIVDDGNLYGSGVNAISYIPSAVSTFQGLARSSYDVLRATVLNGATYNGSGSATALSENAMISTFLKAKEFGNPQYIFMNQLLYYKYLSLITTYKKSYNTTEKIFGGIEGDAKQGGYLTGLDFAAGGGSAIIALDYDCPDMEVYFIDPSTIEIGQLTPMGWLDQGNGNLLRRTDYASFQGVLRWYGNLACKDVRANAKMTNQTS